MKKIIIIGIIGFGLFVPRVTQAQGTLYLSNLGQTPAGSNSVGSDSWIASEIMTGANAGGYLLNSVQLAMINGSGNPSGFTAMIYSETGATGFFPGTNLCTLNGSTDPSTTGIYAYTPASNLMLSPSTIYFLVLTAGTTVANGSYEWSLTSPISYNPIDAWKAGGVWKSSDGLAWLSNSGAPQFSIAATAIPEPSSSLLLLLGSGFYSMFAKGVQLKAANPLMQEQLPVEQWGTNVVAMSFAAKGGSVNSNVVLTPFPLFG